MVDWIQNILHWFQNLTALFMQFGDIGLFVLSFIEASFFPIPPYLLSIPMTLNKPQFAFYYATIGVAGSVLGGILGYMIGIKLGRPLLKHLMKPTTLDKLEQSFAKYGGWAIAVGGVTPIPYKFFTIAAGVFRIRMLTFIPASVVARSIRFYVEAVLLLLWGKVVVDMLEKFLGPVNFIILFVLAVIFLILHKSGVMENYLQPLFKKWQNRLAQYGEVITPVGHFGWFLVSGATLTVFGFLAFVKIADDILGKEIMQFDRLVGGWIVSWQTAWLTGAMHAATMMGSTVLLTTVALLVTILGLLIRRRLKDIATFNLCVIGSVIFTEILKHFFQRPRPVFPWAIHPADSFSFPSGHALQTLSMYGFLAYLIIRYTPRSPGRNLLAVLFFLIPVCTGISRIYLGYHYPSDVLAGWAVATAWVGTCIAGRELLRQRK